MKHARLMTVCALAFALAASARAEAPSLDFDQSLDVSAVLGQAKEQAAESKEKIEAKSVYGSSWRTIRDCARLSFEPGDLRGVSEPVWLRSTEYIEECHPTGDPRYGGGQTCWERPGRTYQERVQVEILSREELRPWEREVVEVCLDGPWVSAYVIAGAHEYKVRENGGHVTLVPGRRIPMDPDEAGIAAKDPVYAGGGVSIEFADRWASYYHGEKTVLKAALIEEVPGWFDGKVVEKELSFDPADTYAVDFAQFRSEFQRQLRPGKKYYVQWSFKRVGQVSKPKQVNRGETGRVQIPQALWAWDL